MKRPVVCPKCDSENIVEHELDKGRKRYDCKQFSCLHSWELNKEGRQEPTGPSNLSESVEELEKEIERKAAEHVESGLVDKEPTVEARAVRKIAASAKKWQCSICGKDDFTSGQAKGQHQRFCKGKGRGVDNEDGTRARDFREHRDEVEPHTPDSLAGIIQDLEAKRAAILEEIMASHPELQRIDKAIKILKGEAENP